MKLLDDYFTAKEKVLEYFGYESNWRELPLEDNTEYYWHLKNNNEIVFADSEQELRDQDGNYYECHTVSSKAVYRKDDYTAIALDTQTDGNCFLFVFDNTKEIKDWKDQDDEYF